MPLEKTVEVTHLVLVPLDTVFARMRVSYNWIYDNSYVVSKIHYESEGGGFLGVATISIWDMHSHLIPTPLWATNIFSHGSKKEKTYYPKLVTILYGGDTFEGIKVDGFDAMNIIIEGWAGLSIPMGLPFPPVPFYETNSICFQLDYTEVPDLPIEAPDLELAYLCSPGELLVYDAQGRVTGLINGDVKNEIPNSSYCNNSIILLPSSESYRYNVAGTEEGTYGLMVASIIEEVNNSFTATDISTSTNATQYTIDWEALAQGEKGVTIQIDSDGDGTFEQNITTDDTFKPPNASFTYSPAHPVVNEAIIFNASESKDHDGYITNYKWEFGDGNLTDTTAPIINHKYALAGDYTVNLTVTDDDGATNATAKMITVSGMPDLIITEKWLCWPDNCMICYNVTNIGIGTAPACHNATLYVDGVAVVHDHVPVALAPGKSYLGCFDGYTWAYTPPSDNITVCADNNEALVELDETNNCLTNIWMCGDVNGDGKVTMSDVRKVFNRYLDPNYPLDLPWAADVNGDGKVTMSDVRKVFNRYLDPGYDLNCCCEGEE
jgi:PKD repeat protein